MNLSNEVRRALPLALLAAGLAVAPASATAATRQVPAAGTTSIKSNVPGADQIQAPELAPDARDDEAGSFNRPRPGHKRGKLPKKSLDTPIVQSSSVAGSNPQLSLSFAGLNHRDQRLADGGNQFSV